MASDFFKLYREFWRSSISQETAATRICFLALLAEADEDGIVRITPRALARFANVNEEEAEVALAALSRPDPDSRTPDEEGRRIVRWGVGASTWQIVNYKGYYRKSREVDRAEYKREWDRKHRSKSSASNDPEKLRQAPTDPIRSDASDSESDRKSERKGNACKDSAAMGRAAPNLKRRGICISERVANTIAELVPEGADE